MTKVKDDGIQELVDEILAKNKIIEELKEEIEKLKKENNDSDKWYESEAEENELLWSLIAKIKGFKDGI
jgi:hypothetical protein